MLVHINYHVSTLPIRNGNRTARSSASFPPLCKYLTYKEWKLFCNATWIIKHNFLCKYLTYKEWKQFLRCYPTSLSSYVITFTINNIQTCYIYSIFIFYSYSVVVYLNKIKNSSIIQCYYLLLKNGCIINVGVWLLPISTFFIIINKKNSKSPVHNNYTWRRCSYERPS